jgi:hypothetical protein
MHLFCAKTKKAQRDLLQIFTQPDANNFSTEPLEILTT